MAYPVNGPLRLRMPNPGDLACTVVWENHPENWAVSNRTTPYSEDFLRRYLEEAGKDFWEALQIRFIIESVETGKPVGAVDVFDAQPVHQRAGIGILLDASVRGQGWARLALEAVHEWAFEHALLRQVYAEVHASNKASTALFERAGYALSGRLRGWHRTLPGFEDVLVYQYFASDYLARTSTLIP